MELEWRQLTNLRSRWQSVAPGVSPGITRTKLNEARFSGRQKMGTAPKSKSAIHGKAEPYRTSGGKATGV